MSAWWEAIGGLSNHVPDYVQNFRKPPEDMSLYQNRAWQSQRAASDFGPEPNYSAWSKDYNVIDVEARVIKTEAWNG